MPQNFYGSQQICLPGVRDSWSPWATRTNRFGAFISNITKKPSSPVGALRTGMSSLHSDAHRLKAIRAHAGGDLVTGVVAVVEWERVSATLNAQHLGEHVPPEQASF
jgi:hypothetical protein